MDNHGRLCKYLACVIRRVDYVMDVRQVVYDKQHSIGPTAYYPSGGVIVSERYSPDQCSIP